MRSALSMRERGIFTEVELRLVRTGRRKNTPILSSLISNSAPWAQGEANAGRKRGRRRGETLFTAFHMVAMPQAPMRSTKALTPRAITRSASSFLRSPRRWPHTDPNSAVGRQLRGTGHLLSRTFSSPRADDVKSGGSPPELFFGSRRHTATRPCIMSREKMNTVTKAKAFSRQTM